LKSWVKYAIAYYYYYYYEGAAEGNEGAESPPANEGEGG
jgi:hypothetical protein